MSLILIGCEPRSLRRCAVELRGERGRNRFPAARQDSSESGRAGRRLNQEERAGCMHAWGKGSDVSRESEEGWTRPGRNTCVIPRMHNASEPRNAIRSSLVFGWRLFWSSASPYRCTISLLCFTLKGLNAIAVIRVMPSDVSGIRYSRETIVFLRWRRENARNHPNVCWQKTNKLLRRKKHKRHVFLPLT